MGFESFQFLLRGAQSDFAGAAAAVERLPGSRPGSGFLTGPRYFEIVRPEAFVEIEVSDAPVSVSCRYALCNPPEADDTVLAIVRQLSTELDMGVTVCDAPDGEEGPYAPDRWQDCRAAAERAMPVRRAEWRAAFGPETAAVGSGEAFRRFILPHGEFAVAPS